MAVTLSHPVHAGMFGSANGAQTSVLREHRSPRDLPPIRFRDMAGKSYGVEDFKGKILLLNIWATWCGYCVKEMPEFARLQARFAGQGFEVITISTDDLGTEAATVKKIKEFFTQNKLKLTPYRDAEGSSFGQLDIAGLPTTLLIDREGKEIARATGPVAWESELFIGWLEKQLVK
jgi:thiol-disulfide isomerase/thioredoxin